MYNGVIGGLLLGGLLAGAIFGLIPGAVLMGLGGAVAALQAAQEAKREQPLTITTRLTCTSIIR